MEAPPPPCTHTLPPRCAVTPPPLLSPKVETMNPNLRSRRPKPNEIKNKKYTKKNPVHKVPSVGFEPTTSGIHLVRLYQAETRKGHGKRPPSPGNGSCWNTLFNFRLVCLCNLPGSGTWSVPWPFPRDPLWQNPLLSVLE